jgi:RNA polymerase sigma factor (sigma-70 family)
LAQETFLTAWKKLPELREPEKLASWLYGIARRVALRWLETQQRNPLRQAAELDADTMTDRQVQIEAEERRHREQSLELIWTTVKELPETLREPLLLYHRYSKSVADIAVLLSLTEEAVRQRLSRGRKMLKAEVEKQVETILEATGPGEYFTVGVLAALSMFATAPDVFAATSAAGSASAAAKSSGGSLLLAWSSTFLQALHIVFLMIFFAVISGVWDCIRNSPTLRSRRFLLKATIFHTMMSVSLAIFFVYSHVAVILISGKMWAQYVDTLQYCYMVFIGFYYVISVYETNRRWRKIVEEDTVQPVDIETLERSRLSLRNLRRFLCCWMAMPFVVFLIWQVIIFTTLILQQDGERLEWYYKSFHALIFNIYQMRIDTIFPFAVIFTLPIFYWVIERRVRDENSLTTWQPRISNYLQVLTGEEKRIPGFRSRTNFWSDILLVGVGLCILQIATYFDGHRAIVDAYHYPVAMISFIAYFLFAVFFAGVPRWRYFGYIYLGVFIAALDAVCVLLVEPWLLGSAFRWNVEGIFLMISLFWLLCFVLSGIAGLLAFRRK